MNGIFSAMISIGFGIVLSPEILFAGIWLASLKNKGLQKAWIFCAGGAIGLLIFLAIGFFLDIASPTGPSWTRFYIRVAISAILIFTGVYVFFKKNDHAEKMRRYGDGDRISLRAALIIGFVITGMNVKVFSIAMAAGHQASSFHVPFVMQILGLLVFFGIAALPLVTPAFIETVSPGVSARIMAPCSRLLERYGNLVTAAICFIFGGIFLKGAFMLLP